LKQGGIPNFWTAALFFYFILTKNFNKKFIKTVARFVYL